MAKRAKSRASLRAIQKPSKKNKSPRRTKSIARHTPLAVQVQQEDRPAQLQAPISSVTAHAGTLGMMEKMHPNFVGNIAYISLCESMGVSGDFLEAAVPSLINFQEQMRPADPLMGLALTQALIAHGRAAWLAKLAAAQTDPKSLCMINEASGRASNTFARLMTAIQQYRRPAATTTTVKIAQANVAREQVVQNALKQGWEKHGNQTRISQLATTAETAALLPNAERPALPAISRQKDAAVDEEHRPPESGRKKSRKPQRVEARRAKRRENRIPKTDEGNTYDA